jgi:hypothetical protein
MVYTTEIGVALFTFNGSNSFGTLLPFSGSTAVPAGGFWAGVKKGTPSAAMLKMGLLHFSSFSFAGVAGRETSIAWCGCASRLVKYAAMLDIKSRDSKV